MKSVCMVSKSVCIAFLQTENGVKSICMVPLQTENHCCKQKIALDLFARYLCKQETV